jgi:hypothetical protein
LNAVYIHIFVFRWKAEATAEHYLRAEREKEPFAQLTKSVIAPSNLPG